MTKNGLPWSERFWRYVDKSGDCWIWIGAVAKPQGYGVLRIDGRLYYAHRLAFLLRKGRWPQGQTRHGKCNNRLCVRHLHEGSARDNVHDAIRSGTFRGKDNLALGWGRPNSRRKLTERQVRWIRNHYRPYDRVYGSAALSKRFKVPHTTIQRVARRSTYKEVI